MERANDYVYEGVGAQVGHQIDPGETIEVNLKSGEKKPVAVGAFLGKQGDNYLYAPAK